MYLPEYLSTARIEPVGPACPSLPLRLVVFERDDVQDQIAEVRVRSTEKRLGAARAVLKGQPDYGRANHFSQSRGYVFRSFLVGDREAEWRAIIKGRAELQEGAAADATRAMRSSIVRECESVEDSCVGCQRIPCEVV